MYFGASIPARKDSSLAMVIPADTANVFGSLGDQLLLLGVEKLLPDHRMELLIDRAAEVHDWAVSRRHLSGIAGGWHAGRAVRSAGAVVIIGADVMDGWYDEYASLRRIAIAAAAAKCGSDVVITGFSFNSKPLSRVVSAFIALDEHVRLCLRDADSLRRFKDATGRHGLLTADLGFLAEPSTGSALATEVKLWVRSQRDLGRRLLAVNINPHVVAHPDHSDRLNLVRSVSSTCERLINVGISLLLVPHDFRDGNADRLMLDQLMFHLGHLHSNIKLLPGPFEARDIMEAIASVDLVFTARMHLAISALSQDVAVCAMSYQDKFSGLMAHFDLDGDSIILPEGALDADALYDFLTLNLARSDSIRQRAIPLNGKIKRLALLNAPT